MMTVLVTLAAVCAQTDASFDQFFKDFASKRDGIEYLEAKFVQENVSRGDVTYSEGTIIYAKPKRIVFQYEKPEPRTVYLIEGRRAYEYEEDISQLQIYDLEDNPQTEIFFLGFDSDTENLRKGYDVALFDADDPAQGKRGIELKPKPVESGESEEGRFKSVRISLRDKDFLPYLIYIVNDEDSQSYIRVKEYKINEKMDPVRTQIMIPAGVKVIENDTVIETVADGGKRFPDQPASSLLPPGSRPPEPEPAKKEEVPVVTSSELAPPSPQTSNAPAPPATEKKP